MLYSSRKSSANIINDIIGIKNEELSDFQQLMDNPNYNNN
jgi:hypothetical protein